MLPLTKISAILAFAKKIFSLQNEAFLLLSIPGSLSLTAILNALLDETSTKQIALPLLTSAVSISLYFIVFTLDFASGVKASKHEALDKTDYFRSAKGWSSLWKIATVTILVLWSSFFSILAAIAQIPMLPGFFMFTSATIAIMATLLDIYSIGENQKRITGKKSRIFIWFHEITTLINLGIINRLKSLFKINHSP